jgi:hypothetical protein
MSVHSLASPSPPVSVMLLKGGPDVVLGKCGSYLSASGEVVDLDEAFREQFQSVYEQLGGQVRSGCVCGGD